MGSSLPFTGGIVPDTQHSTSGALEHSDNLNGAVIPDSHTIAKDSPNFRAIIVEDDVIIYKSIKMIINKRFPSVRIVGHCESVQEVIHLVGKEKPDIVLLDIQVRGGTSFQALAAIPKRTFDIIVMSAQAEFRFAQEAIRYGASEYLVKPFLPEAVIAALEKVIAKRLPAPNKEVENSANERTDTEPIPKSWTIKAKDRTVYILEWEDIIRLKADGKNTIVYTTSNKPILLGKNLKECLQELPKTIFFQSHRSHIINRTYFSHARDGFAFLSNGEKVDVTLKKWTQFLAAMKK